MTSTPSPTTEPVRLTITVTPEVHAAFRRLADASGMSMGKAMGEWLGDTLEAVEFMAEKMEQARAAPRLVMQEMHAYALGLADETKQVLANVKERERAGRASAARARTFRRRQGRCRAFDHRLAPAEPTTGRQSA